jgi:transposase
MIEDEFQQLRKENAALQEENAMLRALVDELLPLKKQVEELSAKATQLQDRQAKDSHNSHMPPSSDRFVAQKKTKSLRKKSNKKQGAQPGHEGNTLSQVADPDQVISYHVQNCSTCHCDLSDVAAYSTERRQVYDIPPKRVVVIEHQTEQKVCPQCHTVTRTMFPAGISAPVQYGPAFGALGVYLTHQQFLPYVRACETIQDLIGPAMSVGTLQELVHKCAANLQPIEEQIKEHLRKAEVRHHDETGLSVMGKRMWGHVASTDQVTHYAVHANRGKKAIDDIGILPGSKGVSVHDGWATYWQYACPHALCNVHHLRELTFLHEEHQQAWAGDLKELLTSMNEAVNTARQQGLSALSLTERTDWKTQYQALLSEGYQANPPDPPPSDGTVKRGRRKQSTARNLLDRLSKHQDAVLLFLECFSVPFDNSQAERDIRMIKIQQKISGGFRSVPGAQAFLRIRSYLSTLRKQCAPVMTALELVLAGHPVSPTF